jgi:transposase
MLEPLLPPETSGGRPRQDPVREVMKGMQSMLRGGGAWRLMPHDLPHWQTASQCCRTWRRDGTWVRLHEQRRADVRTRMGRQPQPSAAVIEAQPVKTTEKGGPRRRWGEETHRPPTPSPRGYDGSPPACPRPCRRSECGGHGALALGRGVCHGHPVTTPWGRPGLSASRAAPVAGRELGWGPGDGPASPPLGTVSPCCRTAADACVYGLAPPVGGGTHERLDRPLSTTE